ncbi:hypothetical protein BXZ70DRAFT_942263 [Cristinia sonorae]|uniref:Uncharacterized protein n=1 Tax=Cristinia sonorae TaxID=1940300 RepID=A0A8K0UMB8_9AGAR|nr:hypothetical protein BXZ70DRAFT_942263 [Cristinia sonorae]
MWGQRCLRKFSHRAIRTMVSSASTPIVRCAWRRLMWIVLVNARVNGPTVHHHTGIRTKDRFVSSGKREAPREPSLFVWTGTRGGSIISIHRGVQLCALANGVRDIAFRGFLRAIIKAGASYTIHSVQNFHFDRTTLLCSMTVIEMGKVRRPEQPGYYIYDINHCIIAEVR